MHGGDEKAVVAEDFTLTFGYADPAAAQSASPASA
jgi:hypothetical protein